MSELNVYHHELRHNEYAEFYLKYEADKIISELKAQKAQAEDDCAYWKTMSQKCAGDNEVMAKQRAEAFKREHHQKYKRCLAMARWCRSRACFYDNMRADSLFWAWKSDRAYKWHKRWLELAEKFKEAKNG